MHHSDTSDVGTWKGFRQILSFLSCKRISLHPIRSKNFSKRKISNVGTCKANLQNCKILRIKIILTYAKYADLFISFPYCSIWIWLRFLQNKMNSFFCCCVFQFVSYWNEMDFLFFFPQSLAKLLYEKRRFSISSLCHRHEINGNWIK